MINFIIITPDNEILEARIVKETCIYNNEMSLKLTEKTYDLFS